MKIQLDIPLEINKFIKIEKVKRNKSNIQETIIEILNEVSNGTKQ